MLEVIMAACLLDVVFGAALVALGFHPSTAFATISLLSLLHFGLMIACSKDLKISDTWEAVCVSSGVSGAFTLIVAAVALFSGR